MKNQYLFIKKSPNKVKHKLLQYEYPGDYQIFSRPVLFVNLGHDIAFNLNKANITGEKNKTNAFLCMAFWYVEQQRKEGFQLIFQKWDAKQCASFKFDMHS